MLRYRIVLAGRQCILEKYDLPNNVKHLAEVFQQRLGGPACAGVLSSPPSSPSARQFAVEGEAPTGSWGCRDAEAVSDAEIPTPQAEVGEVLCLCLSGGAVTGDRAHREASDRELVRGPTGRPG